MWCHYPDLSSASDYWLIQIYLVAPIRSTAKTRVASPAGAFLGEPLFLLSLVGREEIRAPLKTPAGEAKTWVVTRHQYGISALFPQTSFRGETSGSVSKCRLSPVLRRCVK